MKPFKQSDIVYVFTLVVGLGVISYSSTLKAYDGDEAKPWCLDRGGRITYDMGNCMDNGKLTELDKANTAWAMELNKLDTARDIAHELAQGIAQSGNSPTVNSLVNEPVTTLSSHSSSTSGSTSSGGTTNNTNVNTNHNH